jgi:hypothetical protein
MKRPDDKPDTALTEGRVGHVMLLLASFRPTTTGTCPANDGWGGAVMGTSTSTWATDNFLTALTACHGASKFAAGRQLHAPVLACYLFICFAPNSAAQEETRWLS